MRKTVNTVKVTGELSLSCLCLEHKKNSTCEVYLRQTGKYIKPDTLGICPKCKRPCLIDKQCILCSLGV